MNYQIRAKVKTAGFCLVALLGVWNAPVASAQADKDPSVLSKEITWLADIEEAKKQAGDKLLFVSFTSLETSATCKRLNANIYQNEEFAAFAKKELVCVSIDTTAAMNDTGVNPHVDLLKKHKVRTFPTLIFLKSDGAEMFRPHYGGQNPKDFIGMLKHLDKGIAHQPSAPKDPENPFQYSRKSILDTVRNVVAGEQGETLEKAVAFSDWSKVQEFLAGMDPEQRARTFDQLLQALDAVSSNANDQRLLSIADVFSLAECSAELTPQQIQRLGVILGRLSSEPGIGDLEAEFAKSRHFGKDSRKTRDNTHELLVVASMQEQSLAYLPPLDEARNEVNLEAANIHLAQMVDKARHTGADADIRDAMDLIVWVLRNSSGDQTSQREAFEQISAFLLILPEDQAGEWLVEFLKDNREPGLALLIETAEAGESNTSRINGDTAKALMLQNLVVESWLRTHGNDPAIEPIFNTTALSWLKAAQYHISPPKPADATPVRSGRTPVKTVPTFGLSPENLLRSFPSGKWLALASKRTRGEAFTALARLHILAEDPEAFIRTLEFMSGEFPEESHTVANEFIRQWSRVMGLERLKTANEPIPAELRKSATRSLLENIVSTRGLLNRNVSDGAIITAFSGLGGDTYIYQKQDITDLLQAVDKPIGGVLEVLANDMRTKLGSTWRAQTEDIPTDDEEAIHQATLDMYESVNSGYQALDETLSGAIETHPDDWKLLLALGQVRLDAANFFMEQHEGENLSEKENAKALLGYIDQRGQAFEVMEKAAVIYSKAVPEMPKADYNPSIFLNLFIGITETNEIAALMLPENSKEKALIALNDSLMSLPEQAREAHVSLLVKEITQKLEQNGVTPENLYAYMCDAVSLLGEHPGIEKIRKRLGDYQAILKEVELRIEIDGPTDVVHGEEFGVFVVIESTKDLSDQAESFVNYVKDDGHVSALRNDINRSLRKTFRIKSLSFYGKATESYNIERKGWVATPVAYMLLETKDPSADRVPSIKFRLDPRKPRKPGVARRFPVRRNNPPGQPDPDILLPLTSNVVQIGTTSQEFVSRPFSDLKITQTLDTRKSSENKIFLEISAAGRGIVSRLDEVLDPTVPGYTVTKTNDRGVAISKIDTSKLPLSVLSEHLWTLELTFDPKNRGKAEMFRFPAVVRDDIGVVHRQYVDVDPVECGPEVPMTWLPFNYQKLIYYLVGGVLAFIALLVGIRLVKAFLARDRRVSPYTMPSNITPFTVYTLIRTINEDRNVTLSSKQKERIVKDMKTIENSFFLPDAQDPGKDQLTSIAKTWLRAV